MGEMALRIRQLNCKVTVRRGAKATTVLHRPEKPEKPSMAFVVPEVQANAEDPPEPSQTMSEEQGQALHKKTRPSPRKADPGAVAQRVYELMKQEIETSRMRGGM